MNGYFRVRAKPKKEKERAIRVFITILVGMVLLYCIVLPDKCGTVGRWFARRFGELFGKASFVFPVLIILYAVELLRFKKLRLGKSVTMAAMFVVLCGVLSVIGSFGDINYGGLVGIALRDFSVRVFGQVFALVILIFLFLYLSSILFNVSVVEHLRFFMRRLSEDIKEWRSVRELNRKIKTAATGTVVRKTPQGKQEMAGVPGTIGMPGTPEISVATGVPGRKIEPAPVPQPDISKTYQLPSVDLLPTGEQIDKEYRHSDMIQKAALLEQTLSTFNVQAKVTDVSSGPTITRFELTPDPGIKVKDITSLSNDIALALKATSVRVATVPGKGTVGVEVPNPKGKRVGIRAVMEEKDFAESGSKLTIALGKTSEGKSYAFDLTPMPHLLIAGATGSGKSVCIHSIITSILFKARPDEVKFLLIDPKRLELPVYNGLPHLYDPTVTSEQASVVTNPKQSARVLQSMVRVMEKRYEKFARATVRNIDGYNEYAEKSGEPKEFYIVIIIDELADLILTLPREIEDAVQRLAQMARAVGIHLVLATQRPSVDVITGVIKANLSARIAFQVLSKTDSRVILDTMGAEDLLGCGDMLFLPTGAARPFRLQGSYVSEKEVTEIVNFIKKQNVKTHYEDMESQSVEEEKNKMDETTNELIKQALKLILERKRVSQDLLKARFGTSAKASDVLSRLEVQEFIFKPEGTNKWHINYDRIEEYLKGDAK
ncbi:MAG: DNA translocase FtsK 4TM domain-containing protein [Elusimicrobiota bacterium]